MGRRMTVIHEELTRVVAALPDEQVRQVLDFARTLPPPHRQRMSSTATGPRKTC